MKKFLVLLLTTVVLASSFVFPAFAEEPSTFGGFDFYSITFHYSEPVVVDYTYVRREKSYKFNDAVEKYTIYASETRKTQSYSKGETQITSLTKVNSNFTPVSCAELGIDSSVLKYTKYPSSGAYITHIADNTAIKIDGANPYGLRRAEDFYDDEGTRNPNLEVNSAGYFIDVATGQNIDDNGYILDDNGLWHNKKGFRVEPFILNSDGTYKWVSLTERKGEDGRVKKLSDIGDVSLFCIAFDKNGDGAASASELEACNKIDRVFTSDDIYRIETPTGKREVNGSPVEGNPKTKAKITAITIELDALGAQLYDDVASDPQQKNIITLSTKNLAENIKIAEDIVKNNSKKIMPDGWGIIGTAKAITTKTAMGGKNSEYTYKSVTVETTDEILSSIPADMSLYLNFEIGTEQVVPEGFAYADTYAEKTADCQLALSFEKKVTDKTLDTVVEVEVSAFDAFLENLHLTMPLFIIICVVAAVVIAAIVVLIIILSKKKKKKIPTTDVITPVEPTDVPVEENVTPETLAESGSDSEKAEDPKEDTEA